MTYCRTACAKCASLKRWKAEALPLLALLERCHDLLPEAHRAQLGHSKAEAVESYLRGTQ